MGIDVICLESVGDWIYIECHAIDIEISVF
jgi:hypothetical protein